MKRLAIRVLLVFALLFVGCGPTKHDEETLKQNLFSLRTSIDNYTTDRAKAPQSLDDLVRAGYLRTVPRDPITGKSDWVPVQDDSLFSADQTEPGISDVHSASDKTASDGTVYSSW